MNVQAVAEVIRSIGWSPEDYPGHVARARATLARGGSTAQLDVAHRLVAAADSGAAPAFAPMPAVPAPAPSTPAADEPEFILLGMDAAGAPLTVTRCLATGDDPITFLTAPGVTLAAVGRRMLADLQAIRDESPEAVALLAKAQELKIDVERVRTLAAAHNRDSMAALRAEVQLQEQVAEDLNRIGPQGGA